MPSIDGAYPGGSAADTSSEPLEAASSEMALSERTTMAPGHTLLQHGYTVLRQYASAAALLIGIPSCLLIVALLRGVYFRRTSAGVYLIVLTLCDLGLLSTRALRWFLIALSGGDFDLAALGLVGCRIFQYVSHTLHHVSAWSVAAVALERVFAVRGQCTSPQSAHPRHVHLVFMALALGATLLNLHWFWNVTSVQQDALIAQDSPLCPTLRPQVFLSSAWVWTDLTFGDLLPILLLLSASSLLTATLGLAFANKRLVVHSISANNFSNFESQITNIALGLSALFIVARLPMVILTLGMVANLWRLSKEAETLSWGCCHTLQLFFVAFKLPLYLLVARKIHLSLVSVLCCRGGPMAGRRAPHNKNGLEDSELQASKGLSQSTQSSPRGRVEQLKGLLVQLERRPDCSSSEVHTPGGPPASEAPVEQRQPHKEKQAEGGPEGATSSDGDVQAAKPRKKKLSSSRQRKFLHRSQEKESADTEQDSDNCSAASVPGQQLEDQQSVSGCFKTPLDTLQSVPLPPD